MLLTILVILLVLALLGGGFGSYRGYGWGYYGWSPAGILLIILILALIFGWHF